MAFRCSSVASRLPRWPWSTVAQRSLWTQGCRQEGLPRARFLGTGFFKQQRPMGKTRVLGFLTSAFSVTHSLSGHCSKACLPRRPALQTCEVEPLGSAQRGRQGPGTAELSSLCKPWSSSACTNPQACLSLLDKGDPPAGRTATLSHGRHSQAPRDPLARGGWMSIEGTSWGPLSALGAASETSSEQG